MSVLGNIKQQVFVERFKKLLEDCDAQLYLVDDWGHLVLRGAVDGGGTFTICNNREVNPETIIND